MKGLLQPALEIALLRRFFDECLQGAHQTAERIRAASAERGRREDQAPVEASTLYGVTRQMKEVRDVFSDDGALLALGRQEDDSIDAGSQVLAGSHRINVIPKAKELIGHDRGRHFV